MGSNPMQKKTRNAFLLGVLIMLIISIVIGVAVYFLVIDNPAKKESGITRRKVYVTTGAINSGEVIQYGVNAAEVEIETPLTSGLLDASILKENSTSKINLEKGTILTTSMVNQGEVITDDVRVVEYNMITLPVDLGIGDYIDIRFSLPSRTRFCCNCKKRS